MAGGGGVKAGKRLHLGASVCSIKDAHGLEGALTLNKDGNEKSGFSLK